MPADSKTVVYAVTGSLQTLCRLNAKVSLSKLLNVLLRVGQVVPER